jgi:glycosyltransferase involved in cell wall biosynthesis
MRTTVLVEPNPNGHRFQAVAAVAEVAARTSQVLVLTSHGATDLPAFREYVGHLDLRVEEPFDRILPPTRTIAHEVAAACRAEDVDTVVLMDADQSLKRWWYVAPLEFGIRRRPRVVFMLTRYPAKLKVTDWFGWRLRLPKALLALIAMASGSLHHVAGFAGRDDMTRGWLVKRARDPEVCSAHSRDRAALRTKLDLPADRRLVGIFGGINERKNIPLIWDAMQRSSIDADLLLAGPLASDVATWVDSVAPTPRGRILVRDGFLSNEVLDQLVASVDVVPLAMTLNGPSGIMGKALAAGVPVVTAGSEVRAREVVATDSGEFADLDAESIGAAIQRVLARDPDAPRRSAVPPATPEEFAEIILGVPRRG